MNNGGIVMARFTRATTAMLAIALFVILETPAHADEGHTFDGEGAFTTSFYLIGGQYTLYANALACCPARTP